MDKRNRTGVQTVPLGLMPASREFSEAAVVGTNMVLVMKAAGVQIPAL